MASGTKQQTTRHGEPAETADTHDRRDDGDRLAALYGLTPKVESAIIDAIAGGAEDRARACGTASPGRPGRSSGTAASAAGGGPRADAW